MYALVTYARPDHGALDDSLRIFGMIWNRHPVRSVRATDLTRLYVEDVPRMVHDKPVTGAELEHWLSRQLDPDHYLCLGAGQRYSGLAGSCEVAFSSFEGAYESFTKLEQLDVVRDETNNCRVNWRRTPTNANQWWTRALGFD